jgi:hypothetical protein
MSDPPPNGITRDDAVAGRERQFTEKDLATRARIIEVAAQQMFDHGVTARVLKMYAALLR